ncbi:tetratricopeptide repeat protein [Enterococcus faecalis]|uniref:tetratricopeptide repeat protein n=2 Tax=Enterococcus faecalis TaxID=1351 RepID=UPI0020903E05|nr:tetratricopeptide repeat protein [Enterococcus faecalis]MCO5463751.1 tetratricopeptide repeat protein [Enterococcus faecalis]MCO5515117.1 tetratricopeptide repeat protein [Enterococcus faecalis]
MKFFTNLQSYKKQLEKFYIKEKYETIPFLPSEEECKRILVEYKTFPSVIVPKENMKKLNNGLLPGHIIMLWWICNPRTNKENIPLYFLYEYGIDFHKQFDFLISKNYIIGKWIISELGRKTIEKYEYIIRNHKAFKTIDKNGNIKYSYQDKKRTQVNGKIIPFKSTGDFVEDQHLGYSYEQNKDYPNAIKAYESALRLSLKDKMFSNCPPPNIFTRLAIIYRKQKDYSSEIKVLNQALMYYPSSETFQKRLEKAKLLNTKK